ncbi:MAG: hypothetical protein LBO72_01180 [Helicobacteraceae bacterium]|jgi:hypothetical protein|nr:hypothetical protein [Helicobacteraceae bacterium]
MSFHKTLLCLSVLALSAAANEPIATESVETANPNQAAYEERQQEEGRQSDLIIPNAPILKPTNIITIRAIGMGVAKDGVINKGQQMALAKRAAILDGYRQLGEKLHGIKINGRDSVKDAVLARSEIRAEVYSVIRGAEVLETIWDNGLCQVEMEVKIDGRRWYKRLAAR